MRITGTVALVEKLVPQPQVTVQATYFGWMSAFMLGTPSRAASQGSAEGLRASCLCVGSRKG